MQNGLLLKAQAMEDEAKLLRILARDFPDVKEMKDRWGTIRMSSAASNSLVDDVEFRHSCGCCADAPLYAFPRRKVEGLWVYSNPERFVIGERCDGGDTTSGNWEEPMREAGISEAVITKVAAYLASVAPVPNDEENE